MPVGLALWLPLVGRVAGCRDQTPVGTSVALLRGAGPEVHPPVGAMADGRKGEGMLDKIRKLPSSLQGLVVAGALGLSVLAVALIIKLLA